MCVMCANGDMRCDGCCDVCAMCGVRLRERCAEMCAVCVRDCERDMRGMYVCDHACYECVCGPALRR